MLTLGELETRLRFRIGEVDAGLWSEDEIKDVLNESQVEVARDLHAYGMGAWSKISVRIPVEHGAENYVAPRDLMAIDSISHYRKEYGFRQLRKGDVQKFRQNRIDQDEQYDSQYVFYQLRGRENLYFASGIAGAGSTEATLLDPDGDFSDVRVNDFVHNINDGSFARIEGFGSGEISLVDWLGGVSQRFYEGETYRITHPEASRWQIWVYPKVSAEGGVILDENVGNDGNFTLDQDSRITEMSIQVNLIPSDWESDDVMSVSLFDDMDRPVFDGRYGIQRVLIGYNKISLVRPFLLKQNVEYTMRIGGGPTSGRLRLGTASEDYLDLNYTAHPTNMNYSVQPSEFPHEYLSALLDYADYLCTRKKSPQNFSLIQAKRILYNETIEKIREFRILSDPESDFINGGQSDAGYQQNPGFTTNYGDVEF